MHKIWELIAIKHTEVQPDVFEHEHKLQTNSLKFSINKRFIGGQPFTYYYASEQQVHWKTQDSWDIALWPHRWRVRQVLLLWPWGRLCGSGPSAEGASELAAYIVHPMKSQMSNADLLSSKKSVLPCPCRISEEKSLPQHLPTSLPSPRPPSSDNQILHLHSTKSSPHNLHFCITLHIKAPFVRDKALCTS